MAKNPLIVEPSSKAKTLKKYLGSDFEILASYGRIRNLIPKGGAVDPEHDFVMKYEPIKRNAKHVDTIVAGAKEAENIYLATDPDREGKITSWHLREILKTKHGLKNIKPQRVVFHKITKNAVLDAVANPREIEMNLIDAQQTRHTLDYLVGFNLSPLLWKKIRRGLSIGRVQGPALRLIYEHENEIRASEAQRYWTVHLDSHKGRSKSTAKPARYSGAKLEQFDLSNKATQASVLREFEGEETVVTAVEKKKHNRNPTAPFTISTMQQDVVRKLGLTTGRTIRTARQLYEGVDAGQGATGLVTYMCTDSVNSADETLAEIRHYIENKIDKEYPPSAAKQYKTRSKDAQEARETIRPTSVYCTSEGAKPLLNAGQFKLYQMIWQRTVTCQMTSAKFDQATIDITVDKGAFCVTGQVQTFAGFLSVYEESSDDRKGENSKKLSEIGEGDKSPMNKLYGKQHFTIPPPRYSEATLVKAPEEYGIDRPSAYANIIFTFKGREYVTLEQKRLMPTDTGGIVNEFLTKHFVQYIDYHFTVKLEDQLNEIANDKRR